MEQQRPAVLRERQVAELIEDDGILVQEARGELAGLALAFLGIELVDQVHDAVEAGSLTLQDHLTGKRSGQMCFATTRATDEDDVARSGKIFTGVQLADLGFIDHRFFEVERVQIPRHREAGQPQLILIRAGLPISHFRLQQL